MEDPLEGTIFEEREELMVSPTGGDPTLRTGHFIRPTLTFIDGPTLKLPSLPISSESKWSLKVAFNGWRDPLMKWKTWVDRMRSMYESVWKEAGICEAVMCSVYKIRRDHDLVLGVAERWCSETNTFLFPWGEATITLEDMMILGGFSVLGGPVFMPIQSKESVEIDENFSKARKELLRSKAHKVNHSQWMKHFMESGSTFEHEAFLSLWLSRFVFPGNVHDTIGKHVFPIAVHLARGTRIALAPAVLASLYRDLSLLKESIVASFELEENCFLALTLWAPMRLVQIWVWERLLPLQPKPNIIYPGEPRLALWHSLKRLRTENVRSAIYSIEDCFEWRPYARTVANWLFPKFYKEKEQWISCNPCSDEDLESLVRCLRVCQLVGIDCIEPYLPHRVAMQFGMDQDLPGWVYHSNASREIAWINYGKPISDAKLYIPSRLFESDVTTRYLDWWKQSVFAPHDAIKDVVRRRRSSRRSKRLVEISERKVGHNVYVPPKCEENQTIYLHDSKRMKGDNDLDVPPGFAPNHKWLEGHQHSGKQRQACDDKPLSSSMVEYGESGRKESIKKPVAEIMPSEARIVGLEAATECTNETQVESSIHDVVSMDKNGGDSSSSLKFEIREQELEARISKLERLFSRFKTTRFGNRCPKEPA